MHTYRVIYVFIVTPKVLISAKSFRRSKTVTIESGAKQRYLLASPQTGLTACSQWEHRTT